MGSPIVSVESLSKKYCRAMKPAMLYTAADILHETLGLPVRSDRLRPHEFWAVDDVSFELEAGECLGLIGSNGAGKSSLLKLLNGILRPDRGRIRLQGRVGALIEVGAGFHPMLSGRENVYVNGAILGMSRREIERKYDSIVEFSGLTAEALDAPVKTYSSGMFVRLGFAVAAHCEPDILLIDEVLSVGDMAFIGRCRRHIEDLLARGTSVILVTHQLYEVERICQKAIMLEGGRIVEQGGAHAVVDAYRRRAAGSHRAGEGSVSAPIDTRAVMMDTRAAPMDTRAAPVGPRVTEVRLVNAEGQPAETVRVGEWCRLDVELSSASGDETEPSGEMCIWMWNQDTEAISAAASVPWATVRRSREPNRFSCRLPMMAMPGTYLLGVRVQGTDRYDYGDAAATSPFEVVMGGFAPRGGGAHMVLDIHPDCVDAGDLRTAGERDIPIEQRISIDGAALT